MKGIQKIVDEYNRVRHEFALDLIQIGAVEVVTDGLSLNLGTVHDIPAGPLETYHDDTIGQLVKRFLIIQGLAFDTLLGIPRRGARLAETLKRLVSIDKHLIMLDKWEFKKQKRIASSFIGKVPITANRVLVIDDRIETGASAVQTIEILREAGLTVTDAIVFVDYERGGSEALKERDCRLHRVFTTSELLDIYTTIGLPQVTKGHIVPSFTPQAA